MLWFNRFLQYDAFSILFDNFVFLWDVFFFLYTMIFTSAQLFCVSLGLFASSLGWAEPAVSSATLASRPMSKPYLKPLGLSLGILWLLVALV